MLDLKQTPSQPLIAPSILSADFCDMATDAKYVLEHGADMLHIDVMDGHFAPNLTMGPDMVRALRKHLPDAFLDVHLMVEQPELFTQSFIDAGANCLTFHVEVTSHCRGAVGIDGLALLKKIRMQGVAAGIVINPDTVVETLAPFLPLCDMVLVMSVRPGFSGQAFMPEALKKASWIAGRLSPQQRLQMDGGVKPQNCAIVKAAGVDVLVAASAIFGAKDRAKAIEALKTNA